MIAFYSRPIDSITNLHTWPRGANSSWKTQTDNKSRSANFSLVVKLNGAFYFSLYDDDYFDYIHFADGIYQRAHLRSDKRT